MENPYLLEAYYNNPEFPFYFINTQLIFFPIKSKIYKNNIRSHIWIINNHYINYKIIQICDINLLSSIFDGIYSLIDKIPHISIVSEIYHFELKTSETIDCLKEKCVGEVLIKYFPISCYKVFSYSFQWDIAQIGKYISSIDHFLEYINIIDAQKKIDWLRE